VLGLFGWNWYQDYLENALDDEVDGLIEVMERGGNFDPSEDSGERTEVEKKARKKARKEARQKAAAGFAKIQKLQNKLKKCKLRKSKRIDAAALAAKSKELLAKWNGFQNQPKNGPSSDELLQHLKDIQNRSAASQKALDESLARSKEQREANMARLARPSIPTASEHSGGPFANFGLTLKAWAEINRQYAQGTLDFKEYSEKLKSIREKLKPILEKIAKLVDDELRKVSDGTVTMSEEKKTLAENVSERAKDALKLIKDGADGDELNKALEDLQEAITKFINAKCISRPVPTAPSNFVAGGELEKLARKLGHPIDSRPAGNSGNVGESQPLAPKDEGPLPLDKTTSSSHGCCSNLFWSCLDYLNPWSWYVWCCRKTATQPEVQQRKEKSWYSCSWSCCKKGNSQAAISDAGSKELQKDGKVRAKREGSRKFSEKGVLVRKEADNVRWKVKFDTDGHEESVKADRIVMINAPRQWWEVPLPNDDSSPDSYATT